METPALPKSPKLNQKMYYKLILKNCSKIQKKILNEKIRKLKKLEYVEGNELKSIIREILLRLDDVKRNTLFIDGKSNSKMENLLKNIIGNEYFGTNKNKKLFFLIVDRILTQSQHECIHRKVLYENYDYGSISWLSNYNEIEKKCFLERYNVFLLDFIVKPFIRYYYYALADHKSYEIKLIPRDKWNSFRDKVQNELIRTCTITMVNNYKTNVTKPRGFLKLVPKTDTLDSENYRPLVALIDKNRSIMLRYKHKIDFLIKELSIIKTNNLYVAWKNYIEKVDDKLIYGIKLDLFDAFGNVNINILCSIIQNADIFSTQEKNFLTTYIKEQYIFANGKKIYQWHQGLIQGDRLSTRLCNLYMAHMESKHFKDLLNSNNFLHRTVDDIFFCSTYLQEIFDFEIHASRVYILNENKTVKILHCWEDDSDSLPYCGHMFNLKTKEVSRYYSFQPRTNIHHKFKIWNAKYPKESSSDFITSAMRFSSSNSYFSKYLLNTYFNSISTVLINYFQGICFLAFKFITVIDAIIYQILGREHFTKFIFKHIAVFVHYTSRKVIHIIQTYKGKKYKKISISLLENIAHKAFIVVCKTRFSLYKPVISKLKDVSKKKLLLNDIHISPKYFFKLPKNLQNIVCRKKTVV